MVTKTYIPSNLCDSSDSSDSNDRSDSSDSTDSSDSSDSSDRKKEKTIFHKKKISHCFHQQKFYLKTQKIIF